MTLSEFIVGAGAWGAESVFVKGACQMPRQQFGKWALSFSFYNRESKANRVW